MRMERLKASLSWRKSWATLESPATASTPCQIAANPRYKLLKTKLERLQAQYDLETRVEEQMRMEKLIADTQASLAQLDKG